MWVQFTFSLEQLVSWFEIWAIQTFQICEQMLLVGLPSVPVIFFPQKDMCTQAGCGHAAVHEEAESSLRSRQLGGSSAARREKFLTELSSLLLDKPRWPQGVCFMQEILEWKFLCKNA